ncbi:MAG: phage shock protein operon transcriptional activator [Pseudomonadota bacterium]
MDEFRQAPDLIGESPAFLDALAHASASAPLDRPLLIIGERGAGKELLAERLHFLSRRWDGPFVKMNCAAMADELLDSELFGHEAGAFTGATKRRVGKFERAEGGTLFLDEIASASLRTQEKLLRVIEYGEFERVGGEKTLTVDVRVLAAANVHLPALAEQGRFRADLLDRLAFDVIAAPPLRDRKEDIPLLAAHFAARMGNEMGERFDGFTSDAMAQLLAHDWPGNVRELKNTAERSIYRWVSAGGTGPIDDVSVDVFAPTRLMALPGRESESEPTIRPSDTSSRAEDLAIPSGPNGTVNLRDHLDTVELDLTERALRRSNGRQKDAAQALGLTYDQIRGIIRKHSIDIDALRAR